MGSDGFPPTPALTQQRRYAATRFSRATARAIRQAVALATELELHSVAIAGSVWTIRHGQQEQQQQSRASGQRQQQSARIAPAESRTQKQKRRNDARAAAFRARRAAQSSEPAGDPPADEHQPIQRGTPAERQASTTGTTPEQPEQEAAIRSTRASPSFASRGSLCSL
jgi:hypothetical protein